MPQMMVVGSRIDGTIRNRPEKSGVGAKFRWQRELEYDAGLCT
jgi:hypothetical protein